MSARGKSRSIVGRDLLLPRGGETWRSRTDAKHAGAYVHAVRFRRGKLRVEFTDQPTTIVREWNLVRFLQRWEIAR